jgi:hypothetical protein
MRRQSIITATAALTVPVITPARAPPDSEDDEDTLLEASAIEVAKSVRGFPQIQGSKDESYLLGVDVAAVEVELSPDFIPEGVVVVAVGAVLSTDGVPEDVVVAGTFVAGVNPVACKPPAQYPSYTDIAPANSTTFVEQALLTQLFRKLDAEDARSVRQKQAFIHGFAHPGRL